MKVAFVLSALLVLFPFGHAIAASDYLLKIEGVDGETTTTAPAARVTEPVKTEPIDDWTMPPTAAVISDVNRDPVVDVVTVDAAATGSVAAPASPPQEASTDVFIKIPPIEGESAAVPGVEPDEIDVKNADQPLTPDFSILLGGGSDDDEAASRRADIAEVLMQGAREAGAPAEQISLNDEKIKTKMRQQVKLFGFLPVTAMATVEIDAEDRVSVRYPWWSFFASGKDAEGLGKKVAQTLSEVMATKQDALKAILNVVR